MVSPGVYILNAIALGAVALSLGFAAFHLRQRLLPGWEGAPARLVEVVAAVALLIWLCELLGLFDLLYGWSLATSSVLLAGFLLTAPPAPARPDQLPRPPRPPTQPGMTVVAVVVVALVFAH